MKGALAGTTFNLSGEISLGDGCAFEDASALVVDEDPVMGLDDTGDTGVDDWGAGARTGGCGWRRGCGLCGRGLGGGSLA